MALNGGERFMNILRRDISDQQLSHQRRDMLAYVKGVASQSAWLKRRLALQPLIKPRGQSRC